MGWGFIYVCSLQYVISTTGANGLSEAFVSLIAIAVVLFVVVIVLLVLKHKRKTNTYNINKKVRSCIRLQVYIFCTIQRTFQSL